MNVSLIRIDSAWAGEKILRSRVHLELLTDSSSAWNHDLTVTMTVTEDRISCNWITHVNLWKKVNYMWERNQLRLDTNMWYTTRQVQLRMKNADVNGQTRRAVNQFIDMLVISYACSRMTVLGNDDKNNGNNNHKGNNKMWRAQDRAGFATKYTWRGISPAESLFSSAHSRRWAAVGDLQWQVGT